LAALLAAGCATVEPPTQTGPTTVTTDRYFRVDATPGTDRKGRPIVWGYVHGGGGGHPRLLMETHDAAGKPTAQQVVFVDQDFAGGRVYYEARPQTPGLPTA
jgi:hypothetical protein